VKTLHLIGSKTLGGAERWFIRFTRALADLGEPTHALVRRGSDLVAVDWGQVVLGELPMSTVWDPLSRLEVRRAVRRIAPDLVQTYMGRATRLTHLRGRPLHLARLGNYYDLRGYRHCDAWIGNTRGICDYLIRAGFPPERVHLIYNFADLHAPAPPEALAALRRQWSIPADAWVLVAPGRLTPIKGFDDLLQGFARLAPAINGRPPLLLLLGEGPLRQKLEQLAGRLGVGERVRFTGWQNEPGPYYDLADLVVFPAKPGEPFGNVLIETWAHRRPLLATEFLGAQEVTRHGEDAWRIPCEDPEALAKGITRLLGDDGLRDGLAEQGQLRAVRDFSSQAILAEYLDLYRTLVAD
jgi:glycosyltransferase involved in cell wall biosynthesis